MFLAASKWVKNAIAVVGNGVGVLGPDARFESFRSEFECPYVRCAILAELLKQRTTYAAYDGDSSLHHEIGLLMAVVSTHTRDAKPKQLRDLKEVYEKSVGAQAIKEVYDHGTHQDGVFLRAFDPRDPACRLAVFWAMFHHVRSGNKMKLNYTSFSHLIGLPSGDFDNMTLRTLSDMIFDRRFQRAVAAVLGNSPVRGACSHGND